MANVSLSEAVERCRQSLKDFGQALQSKQQPRQPKHRRKWGGSWAIDERTGNWRRIG